MSLRRTSDMRNDKKRDVVAIYTRISQMKKGDNEGENESGDREELAVERQEEDCRRKIPELIQRGVIADNPAVIVYCDNGVSAYDLATTRPEFERLLTDADKGKISAVIAYNTDRLYRQVKDMYRVAERVRGSHSVSVHTVLAGDIDFGSAHGRLTATLMGAIAQHEVELKGERQKAQTRHLAEQGLPRRAGKRPFGYGPDKDGRYTVLQIEEADAIRDAINGLLDGTASVTGLLRQWNRNGMTTVRGNQWRHSSLIAVLTRYRNAGIREHLGEPLRPAKWPSIVSPARLDELRAFLAHPSRISGTDRVRKHLLSFIIRCGRCGTGMRAAPIHSRGRVYLSYQCPGTAVPAGEKCRRSVSYEVANLAAREYVAFRLSMPEADLLKSFAPDRERVAYIRKRLSELDADEEKFREGRLSTKSLVFFLGKITVEREELQASWSEMSKRSAFGHLLSDIGPKFAGSETKLVDMQATVKARQALLYRFDGLDLDQQREIIRLLCQISVDGAQKGVQYRGYKSLERIRIQPWERDTGNPLGDELRASDFVVPKREVG